MIRFIHAYRVAAGFAVSISGVLAAACAQQTEPPANTLPRVETPTGPVSVAPAPSAQPATTSADAIKTVLTAADPSAAINAYGQAVAAGADIAEVQRAFVRRMVEFQIPEMADAQARDLVARDPAAGLAQAVVAYNAAKNSQTDEALSRIASATQLSPDDPFVQRTAGQIIAWFDTKADRTKIPDDVRAAVEAARDLIADRTTYKDAYARAREAYMAADSEVAPDAANAGATSTIPITPATPAVTNIYNTYQTYEPAPVVYDTAPSVFYGGVAYDPWYPSAWCYPTLGWWGGFSTAILIDSHDHHDHHNHHGHGDGHHDHGGNGNWHGRDGDGRGNWNGRGGGGGVLVPPRRTSSVAAMPGASVAPMTSSVGPSVPLQSAPITGDLRSAIRATPGAASKLTRQYQQQAARGGFSSGAPNSGPMLTPSSVPAAAPNGPAMPSTRGSAMPTPRGAIIPTPTAVSRPSTTGAPAAPGPRLSKQTRSSAPAMPARSAPAIAPAPRAAAPAPRASAPAPRAAAPAPRVSAPVAAPRPAASAPSAPAMSKGNRSAPSGGGGGGGGGMSKGRR